MPRPGTPVVPAGWEQHHRPVANATMTATCDITRPDPDSPPVFDPETGTTTQPTITVVTQSPCRVQETDTGSASEAVAAGQQITAHTYLVTLPYPTDEVEIDDTVTITAASDPSLTGRGLTVADVMRGSLLWERDLICVDDQG